MSLLELTPPEAVTFPVMCTSLFISTAIAFILRLVADSIVGTPIPVFWNCSISMWSNEPVFPYTSPLALIFPEAVMFPNSPEDPESSKDPVITASPTNGNPTPSPLPPEP